MIGVGTDLVGLVGDAVAVLSPDPLEGVQVVRIYSAERSVVQPLFQHLPRVAVASPRHPNLFDRVRDDRAVPVVLGQVVEVERRVIFCIHARAEDQLDGGGVIALIILNGYFLAHRCVLTDGYSVLTAVVGDFLGIVVIRKGQLERQRELGFVLAFVAVDLLERGLQLLDAAVLLAVFVAADPLFRDRQVNRAQTAVGDCEQALNRRGNAGVWCAFVILLRRVGIRHLIAVLAGRDLEDVLLIAIRIVFPVGIAVRDVLYLAARIAAVLDIIVFAHRELHHADVVCGETFFF